LSEAGFLEAVRGIVGLIVLACVVLILGCTVLLAINEVRLKLTSDVAVRERRLKLRMKYGRFQQFTVSLFLLSAVVKFFLG
jgi:uncharacterized membrane protein